MTTILLIRHGLTDAIGHTLTGTQPGLSLSDEGRRGVERLVEHLRDVRIAAIASSPLERALETATPLALDHALEIEVVPELTEVEFGDWTGRVFPDLDQDREWKRFNEIRSLARPPRGELMLDVQRRAVAALIDLAARYPSTVIAAVTHGDVIRASLLYVLGMPIDFVHRIEIAPATVSVVELGEGPPRVSLLNADSVPDRL